MNIKKMIATFTLLGFLLLVTIAFCKPFKKKQENQQTTVQIAPPKGTVLLNSLHGASFNMELIYGKSELFSTLTFTPNTFSLTDQNYSPYTNGFIEANRRTLLLKAVNSYRLQEGLEAITDFDYCEIIDNYAFLGLNQGLHTLYIINLNDYSVINCEDGTLSDTAYVYHITKGIHAYYVLSYDPSLNIACWYALSLEDFSLISSKQLMPPHKMDNRNSCALDDQGNVYFIDSNEILLISNDEPFHMSLDFTPDAIFYEDNKIYTFSISDLFLSYVVFNQSFEKVAQGQANLPNKQVTLTACTLKNNYLYTICEDKHHPLYDNYITVYNITHHEMIYCIALKENQHNFLLDGWLLAP